MSAFLPLIIWLLSAMVCHYLAVKRNLSRTLLRRLFVVLFGPLAIPFVFLLKPEPGTDLTRDTQA